MNHGCLNNIKPATHVVVGATAEDCEGVTRSKLFDVLITEVVKFEDGSVTKLKFCLADVDTFEEPCVVVPNIGGPDNGCFWLKPKARWLKLFIQWLRALHSDDKMECLTALDQMATDTCSSNDEASSSDDEQN